MFACRVVDRNLTAWADGELAARAQRRVSRHLDTCAACATQARELQRAVQFQRQALRSLQQSTEPPDEALWRAVLRARQAESPRRAAAGWAWLRPLAIGCAVTMFSLVAFVGAAGGPQAVLVPLGIKQPPPVVSRAPALFKEYQVIEKLEMLEHFETVDTVPLDEEAESDNG